MKLCGMEKIWNNGFFSFFPQIKSCTRCVLVYNNHLLHQDSTKTRLKLHRLLSQVMQNKICTQTTPRLKEKTPRRVLEHYSLRLGALLLWNNYCTKTTSVWVHGKKDEHQDVRLGGILFSRAPRRGSSWCNTKSAPRRRGSCSKTRLGVVLFQSWCSLGAYFLPHIWDYSWRSVRRVCV